MTIGSLKAGDIVFVDKKGRLFYAAVLTVPVPALSGDVEIVPFDHRISYHFATANEIKGIWRATKATREAREARISTRWSQA